MDKVEAIEAEIRSLSPDDYRRLSDWFQTQDQAQWDEQLDRDSASGKLNFFFEEAEEEAKQGQLRAWPLSI